MSVKRRTNKISSKYVNKPKQADRTRGGWDRTGTEGESVGCDESPHIAGIGVSLCLIASNISDSLSPASPNTAQGHFASPKTQVKDSASRDVLC